MQPRHDEYKGHRIELRAAVSAARAARPSTYQAEPEPELFIDDEPVQYGRHVTGEYFFHAYAYAPSADLFELARSYIDARAKSVAQRRSKNKGA